MCSRRRVKLTRTLIKLFVLIRKGNRRGKLSVLCSLFILVYSTAEITQYTPTVCLTRDCDDWVDFSVPGSGAEKFEKFFRFLFADCVWIRNISNRNNSSLPPTRLTLIETDCVFCFQYKFKFNVEIQCWYDFFSSALLLVKLQIGAENKLCLRTGWSWWWFGGENGGGQRW